VISIVCQPNNPIIVTLPNVHLVFALDRIKEFKKTFNISDKDYGQLFFLKLKKILPNYLTFIFNDASSPMYVSFIKKSLGIGDEAFEFGVKNRAEVLLADFFMLTHFTILYDALIKKGVSPNYLCVLSSSDIFPVLPISLNSHHSDLLALYKESGCNFNEYLSDTSC
jgi:hypothetical protein